MSSQVEAAADALEEAGGWEGSDPQDVHDTIAALPRIPVGAQELLDKVASTLEDHPNISPETTDAIHEAASQLGTVGQQLEERLRAGVMTG